MELPQIVTRVDAHAARSKTYFTGRPCKNGHISPRYVSTAGCIACLRSFSSATTPTPGTVALASQQVHPDDAEEIYKTIDFYNAARGLPRAVRPLDSVRVPTRWEAYVAAQFARPRERWPTLDAMRRHAAREGFPEEYLTTQGPLVDTWSGPEHARQTSMHSAQRDAARAKIQADMERDGYAN